jgi:hypothetical protein
VPVAVGSLGDFVSCMIEYDFHFVVQKLFHDGRVVGGGSAFAMQASEHVHPKNTRAHGAVYVH